MSEACHVCGSRFRIVWVTALTIVLLALLGFGYQYDKTHSFAARAAQAAAVR